MFCQIQFITCSRQCQPLQLPFIATSTLFRTNIPYLPQKAPTYPCCAIDQRICEYTTLYVSLSSRIFGSPHHKFQQPHSHAYPTPHTDKCVEEQFASGKVTTHLITNGMSAFVAKQIVAHKTLRGWKSSKWTYFAIYLFGCCWKAFLRRQQLQQQHWTGSSLATTQRSHKWHGVVLWQPVRRRNSAHTGALEPVVVALLKCFSQKKKTKNENFGKYGACAVWTLQKIRSFVACDIVKSCKVDTNMCEHSKV